MGSLSGRAEPASKAISCTPQMFRDLISSYERKFDEVRNELLCSWVSTGIEQISIISGKAASPVIVSRIIKVCLDHRPCSSSLDANASLKQAHDISEPLQLKIERLPFVERSFVHVDYECCH
uniref:Cation efflux protein cytoplasmic domain-containing protein n=1 Tax=Trichuris muris TaxID=70415 RepID=A0A5S6Q3B7_TRIMR